MKKFIFLLAILFASFSFLSAQGFVQKPQDVSSGETFFAQLDQTRVDCTLGYVNGTGTYYNSYGYNGLPVGTTYLSGCISFTQPQMANYVGATLHTIRYYGGSSSSNANMTSFKVWIKNALDGAVVYTQDIPVTSIQFLAQNLFVLTTPYTITNAPLVIGYTAGYNLTASGGRFPFSVENAFPPYPTGCYNVMQSPNATGHGTGAVWGTSTERALMLWGLCSNCNLPANDLAATSVTSYELRWVNKTQPFTVTVFNSGTAPQSNYTVQLLSATDAVLATQAVTTSIAPGGFAYINLNYTIPSTTNFTVKGKVILTGDLNPVNDVTPNATIDRIYALQPMGYCDNSPTSSMGNNAANTISGAIGYPAANMTPFIGKKLSTIELSLGVAPTMLSNCSVWVRSSLTEANLYSQPFTPVQGWNTITLTTPFNIPATGDFFIGYTVTTTGGYPLGTTANTQNTNGGWFLIGTSGTWNSMSTNGGNPIAGNLALIGVMEAGSDVFIATSANPGNAGTTSGGGLKPIGTPVTVTATANSGWEFQNWTEGSTVVSTTASYNFTASVNRTLVANFHSVGGIICDDLQVGNGTAGTCRMPLNAFYKSSYSQQIFTAADLGNPQPGSTIESLAMEWFYTSPWTFNNVKIYIGQTAKNNFPTSQSASDWETPSALTLVKQTPSLTFNNTTTWTTVDFDTPFEYQGGNIVVAMSFGMHTTYLNSSNHWRTHVTPAAMNMFYQSDATLFDINAPVAPTSGYTADNNMRANTIFKICTPGESGNCNPPTNLNVVYNGACASTTLTWTAPVGKKGGTIPTNIQPIDIDKKIDKSNKVRNESSEQQRGYVSSGIIEFESVNEEIIEQGRGPASEYYCGYWETPCMVRKGNLTTFTPTNVGSAGSRYLQAMEYVGGTLYVVDYGSGNNFGKVSMTNGAWTTIASNVPYDAVSLCYNPTNGLTYTFPWGGGPFGTVNLTNGAYTHIGNVGTSMYATIDNDGVCYAITVIGGITQFGKVNLATGAFTNVANITNGATGSVQELAIDRETNELLWAAVGGSTSGNIYKINKTTGVPTLYGTIAAGQQIGVFATITAPPVNCDPVTNLNAVATGNTVNLSWTAAPGSPTGYKIEYDGTTLVPTQTATSYTHTPVPDGLHTYVVTALYGTSCIPFGVTKTVIVGDMCIFKIEMQDSYGDGWSGSYIEVKKNGVSFGTATVPYDSYGTTAFLVLPSGQLNFSWVNTGSTYDSEVSFQIYNSADQLIYTCNEGTAAGWSNNFVFFTYQNECGSSNPPGDFAYNVYCDGNQVNTTPITTETYTDNTMDISIDRVWSVKAICEAGGLSAAATKEMEACEGLCFPPTNLTVDYSIGCGTATLNWDGPIGIMGGGKSLTPTTAPVVEGFTPQPRVEKAKVLRNGVLSANPEQGAPFNGGERAPETNWLTRCYGTIATELGGIGTGGALDMTNGARYTPADLALMGIVAGDQITKVRFAAHTQGAPHTTCEIKIYQGGSWGASPNPGTTVCTQSVPVSSIINDNWTEVVLTTPVTINTTQELWVMVRQVVSAGYPALTDAGPMYNGKGNISYAAAFGGWQTLDDLGGGWLSYNWAVEAFVTGTPTPSGLCDMKFEMYGELEDSWNGDYSWDPAYLTMNLNGQYYATIMPYEYFSVPSGSLYKQTMTVRVPSGNVTFTYTAGDYSNAECSFKIFDSNNTQIYNAPQGSLSGLTGTFFTYANECGDEPPPPPPGDYSYNIYRNGFLLKAGHTTRTYVDDIFNASIPHTWAVSLVCPDGVETERTTASMDACMSAPAGDCNPPQNLVVDYSADCMTAHLTWEEPIGKKAPKAPATVTTKQRVTPTDLRDCAAITRGETRTPAIPVISNDGFQHIDPSRAILWNNGPLITHPGAGAAGADASATNDPYSTLYGSNASKSNNYTVADDFIIQEQSLVQTINFYAYQTITTNTPTSTITGVYVRIWKGHPQQCGEIVWGDLTTNRMASTSLANINRVMATTLTNTDRKIMNVVANINTVLDPGIYWVEWQYTGSTTSGPWVPPVTILGSPETGNAIQGVNGVYQPASAEMGGVHDYPFIINGNGTGTNKIIAKAPTALTGTPVGIQLKCKLDWTNPATAFGSATLTNITKMVVERNCVQIAELTPAGVGAAMTYTDNTVPQPGKYTYSVYAVTPDGNGPRAFVTVLIGPVCGVDVNITSVTFGDGFNWTLTDDATGTVLLSGGYNSPSLTSVVAGTFSTVTSGPSTFYIWRHNYTDNGVALNITVDGVQVYSLVKTNMGAGWSETFLVECDKTAPPGAYYVYRDNVNIGTTGDTFYDDHAFESSTAHTWAVRILCDDGSLSEPIEATMAACGNTGDCNPPTDLIVEWGTDCEYVDLTWTEPETKKAVVTYATEPFVANNANDRSNAATSAITRAPEGTTISTFESPVTYLAPNTVAYMIDCYPGNNIATKVPLNAPGSTTTMGSGLPLLPGGGDWINSEWYCITPQSTAIYKVNHTTGAYTVSANHTIGGGLQAIGMAHNPIDQTTYVSASSNDGTICKFYKVNVATGATTDAFTANLSGQYLSAFTITNEGRFIILDLGNDNICEINPTNGAITTLFPCGFNANYIQDMTIDRETNTVYWAAYDGGIGQARLYVFNLTNNTLQNLGTLPGEMVAFAIPTESNPNLAKAPTNVTLTPNGIQLNGTFSWTNPTQTMGGTALTAIQKVVILRNGTPFTESTTNTGLGQTYTIPVTVTAAGTHSFTVYAVTTAGNGGQGSASAVFGDMCSVRFEKFDNWGDGWNGAFVTVQINGATVATVEMSGGSYANESIIIPSGEMKLLWTKSTSGFDCESALKVYDSDDILIFSSPTAPTSWPTCTGSGNGMENFNGLFLTYELSCGSGGFKYNVYRDGGLIAANVQGAYYKDEMSNGYNPEESHTWTVKRVCDDGGESEPATAWKEYCWTHCDPVTNLQGEYTLYCDMVLTWDPPTGKTQIVPKTPKATSNGVSNPTDLQQAIADKLAEEAGLAKTPKAINLEKLNYPLTRMAAKASSYSASAPQTIGAPSFAQGSRATLFTEGFESTTGTPTQNPSTGVPTYTPPLPTGWTKSNTTGHNWGTVSNLEDVPGCGDDFPPHTGNRMMYNTWSASGNTWAFSPGFDLAAGTAYTVSFWYNAMGWAPDNEPDNFEVRIGTTNTAAGMASAQLVFSQMNQFFYFDFVWRQATYTFTPTAAGTYYLGFHDLRPAGTGLCIMIDDILVSDGGTNPPPPPPGDCVDVVIGTGTSNWYDPLPGWYGWSRNIMLYEAGEIGNAGEITELALQISNTNTSPRPMKIYLKYTSASTLEAQYVWNTMKADAILVYDAPTSFPTAGWQTFTLAEPFVYDGTQNLLVLVEGTGCTITGGCAAQARYSTKTNCHWHSRTDNNPPNDAGLAGTRNNDRPNITFTVCQPPAANLGYFIFRDGELVGNTMELTFTDTDFDPTLPYTWCVKVACEEGGFSHSECLAMDACACDTPPVENLEGEFDKDCSIMLTWDKPVGKKKTTVDPNSFNFNTIVTEKDIADAKIKEEMAALNSNQANPSLSTHLRMGSVASELIIPDNITQPIDNTGGRALIFSEYFNNSTLPAGWLNLDIDGDNYKWQFTQTAQDCSTLYPEGHTGTFSINSASYYNCVGELSPNNWLITPQITVGVNTVLKYWVKVVDQNYPTETYGIYVSTTGTNPSDFTQVFQETLSAAQFTWTQRTVNIPQTGNIYIAFRHFNSYDMYIMLIDDIEVTGDLGDPCDQISNLNAVVNQNNVALTWTAAPGSPLNYQVLRDGALIGTVNVTNYTDVNVPQGDHTYCVKAVYSGSCIPISVCKSVNVPEYFGNCEAITCGTSTSDPYYRVPVTTFYNYSYSQQIYDASCIGDPGIITHIAFQWAFSTPKDYPNQTIYLMNTTKSTFTGVNDYLPISQFTQVYSGTVYYTNTAPGGWVLIELDTPFEYDGDNLCIAYNNNKGTGWFSGNTFHRTSAPGKSIVYYQDTGPINPANPSASNTSAETSRANAKFVVCPGTLYNVYVDGEKVNDEPITKNYYHYANPNYSEGHTYCVKVLCEDGKESLPVCIDKDECIPCQPVENLTAAYNIDDCCALLTWEPPLFKSGKLTLPDPKDYVPVADKSGKPQTGSIWSSAKANGALFNGMSPDGAPNNWIKWCGPNDDGIGSTAPPATYSPGARFLPSDLSTMGVINGDLLTKVRLYINETSSCTFTLNIYQGGTSPTNPGTLVYTQPLPNMIAGNNEIVLTTPYVINASQELWVTYKIVQNGYAYPAGCDAGPRVPNKGDIFADGDNWDTFYNITSGWFDINWNIEAFIATGNTNLAAAPTNVTATPVGTSLMCKVAWKNPTTNLAGAPLTSITKMVVKRGGTQIWESSGPVTIGGNMTCTDATVPNAGEHCYSVYAVTSEGDGAAGSDCAVIGSMCNITFKVSDGYGDGWNGGGITVKVDGATVGSVTCPSGPTYPTLSTQTLLIPSGNLTLTWTAGSWDMECYVEVYDANDALIYVSNLPGPYTTPCSTNPNAGMCGKTLFYDAPFACGAGGNYVFNIYRDGELIESEYSGYSYMDCGDYDIYQGHTWTITQACEMWDESDPVSVTLKACACYPPENLTVFYYDGCEGAELNWDPPVGKSGGKGNIIYKADVVVDNTPAFSGVKSPTGLMCDFNPNSVPSTFTPTRDWPYTQQFNWDISDFNPAGTTAIATDGNFIYVGNWQGPTIYKLSMSGNLLSTFTIPGISTLRALTYDGTNFYGSSATSSIWKLDMNAHTILGTITIAGGVQARHCAYDPTEDGFWVGNWTGAPSADAFVLVSKTGAEIRRINPSVHGLSSIYGTAVDHITAGGPYLFAQTSKGDGSPEMIYRLNLNTGTQTTQTYTLIAGGGGMFFTKDVVTGTWTLMSLVQNEVILGWKIADSNPNLAAAPTNFVATPVGTTTKCKLTWINPTVTVAGNPLTSITKIVVERGGTPIHEFTTAGVGQAMSYTDVAPSSGIYSYAVYAVTSEGNGQKATASATLGNFCDYTFIVADSYGDGWNGAAIAITVDGASYGSVTCPSGNIPYTIVVSLPAGEIKFSWTKGSYDSECSFQIFDFTGTEIYNVPVGGCTSMNGLFLTYESDCGGPGTQYNIYRDGVRIEEEWSDTTYEDMTPGMNPYLPHCWYVRAICTGDGREESEPSNEVCLPMCEDPSEWLVFGVIENANGELITGAAVTLTEATFAYIEYTTTSVEYGRFEFPAVYKASYILTINAPGYQIHTQPVIVTGHTNLGTITILEIPYPPTNVVATDKDTYALSTWGDPVVPPMTLKGYKIFRLFPGQEANPELWITLTTYPVPDMQYKDYTWATAGYGDYIWGVRTCYAGGVESDAAFSNMVHKDVEVKYTVQITTNTGESPQGAVVTFAGANTYWQFSPSTGTVTFPIILTGEYTLTVTLPGYEIFTQTITITEAGTTPVLLVVLPFEVVVETMDCGAIVTWNQNKVMPFNGFTVYLNGEVVKAGLQKTEYLLTNLPEGDYTVGIEANYKSGYNLLVNEDFTITICTGIIDIESGDFILFPNPADNKLFVERGNNELAYIEIYNPMGMFIARYETTESTFEINVAELAAGTYFIKLTEGDKSGVKGFVKR